MIDTQNQYIFMITLGVIIVLTPLLRAIFQRIGISMLVAYLALGFTLRLIHHNWPIFTPFVENGFLVLANVGLVLLLFRVGLRSSLRGLIAKLPRASLIWIGDVVVSSGVGYLSARYLLDLPQMTSLVVAAALSATSVAVAVVLWQETNTIDTDTGQLLVDVAELDDISALIFMAILIALIPVLQAGGGDVFAVARQVTTTLLLKLVLFVVLCYLFAHYLEPHVTRFSRRVERSSSGLTLTIAGLSFAIAALAGWLGFSLAIGALFAGLAFSRDPSAVRTDKPFTYLYDFFTPFFFIHMGAQINPTMVLGAVDVGALLIVAAIVGKLLGVVGPAVPIIGRNDAALLGISMIPRAEITMVILYQCRQLSKDIVPDEVFAGVVLVTAATTIACPLVLRPLLNRRVRD
jgi:Kef-type K+ transport system membrane component KefB